MKQCPTCNQTYADTQMFCLDDGSELIERVTPQSVMPPTVAGPYYQAPPQYGRATPPVRSTWLAVISVVIGGIACSLLIYVAAQTLLSPHVFRREFVSLATLGTSGVALGLGVPLTALSVLAGVIALALSLIKPQRFGGRVLAIVGPVACVIACALALGLFTFRRLQGPPSYGQLTYYAPTSNSNSSTRTTTSNSNSNSSPRTTTTSSSMTDEEKYRLFYAATKTEDKFLQAQAARKIGVIDGSGKPTSSYGTFVSNAMSWATNDVAFIRSVDSPTKARAYVNAHMDY
jgi:hypothetical protein